MFSEGQRTPLLPLLVPCTGLSHCSIVCRIYPFEVCQTLLQNLPSPLPQTIIFPFLAPFWTLLFFPAFKRRLVFPSPNRLILNSVSLCYDFPSACGLFNLLRAVGGYRYASDVRLSGRRIVSNGKRIPVVMGMVVLFS